MLVVNNKSLMRDIKKIMWVIGSKFKHIIQVQSIKKNSNSCKDSFFQSEN